MSMLWRNITALAVGIVLASIWTRAYTQWSAHRGDPYGVCAPPRRDGGSECCILNMRAFEWNFQTVDFDNHLKCVSPWWAPVAGMAQTFWSHPGLFWKWPADLTINGLPTEVSDGKGLTVLPKESLPDVSHTYK